MLLIWGAASGPHRGSLEGPETLAVSLNPESLPWWHTCVTMQLSLPPPTHPAGHPAWEWEVPPCKGDRPSLLCIHPRANQPVFGLCRYGKARIPRDCWHRSKVVPPSGGSLAICVKLYAVNSLWPKDAISRNVAKRPICGYEQSFTYGGVLILQCWEVANHLDAPKQWGRWINCDHLGSEMLWTHPNDGEAYISS